MFMPLTTGQPVKVTSGSPSWVFSLQPNVLTQSLWRTHPVTLSGPHPQVICSGPNVI